MHILKQYTCMFIVRRVISISVYEEKPIKNEKIEMDAHAWKLLAHTDCHSLVTRERRAKRTQN